MVKILAKIKWWHIAILLICFLGMMIAMRYAAAQVKKASGGIGILDLNFGNTVEFIRQTILSLGDSGRNYYMTFFIIDGFYAISYTAFYLTAIAFLLYKLKLQENALYCLALLPAVGMLLDWTENALLGISVSKWDKELNAVYKISNICTVNKFIFVYLSLMLVLILLIILIVKFVKKYDKSTGV